MEHLEHNKILTRDGVIELFEDEIIIFRVHDHIRKPEKERLDDIINAYDILCKGKKFPLMMIANQIDRLDKEEEEIIREVTPKFFTCQAVVTNNKFTVMVVNLALSIKKPSVPTKIFSNEEAAMSWLRNQ